MPILLILGVVSVVQFAASPHSGKAHADPPAGTGGVFVPISGRFMDTRNGTGGYSTPMVGGAWRTVPMLGHAGIPSTGVSAVMVNISAINHTTGGYVRAVPDNGTTPPTTTATFLNYNAVDDQISNSGIVAPGSANGGGIQVFASTATDIVIDIEGYFTVGNGTTAAGGFVPVTPAEMASTLDGSDGLTQHSLTTGNSVDIQATGVAGVPSTATGVFVSLVAKNEDTTNDGIFTPYATGSALPSLSLNFKANGTTAISAAVDLNDAGRFTVKVQGQTTSVDLQVVIEGYFDGQPDSAVFSPLNARMFDSRTGSNTPVAANGATEVFPATNVAGVPASPVGAVAISVTIIPSGTTGATGHAQLYADDSTGTAAPEIPFYPSTNRTELLFVAPGADGGITLQNSSTGPVDFVVDVEGWFATPKNLPDASGTSCISSGNRSGSQMITHQLTDRSQVGLNPTNGNLLATGNLLHLRGVGQDVSVSWRYNSINDTRPTLNVGYLEDRLLVDGSGNLTYVGSDGGCYKYVKSSTSFTTPAGINATLTNPSAGAYLLRFNGTGITNVYHDDGRFLILTSTQDASSTSSPNTVTYTYSGSLLRSITDTQGRIVNFSYADTHNPTQPTTITDTSLNRSITLAYASTKVPGALSLITDATGATTALDYAGGNLTNITDSLTSSTGNQTAMTYTTGGVMTHWTYGYGTSDAAPWSASYDNATQTTITDPKQHAAVYTISGSTVTLVKDANNRTAGSSWDAHDNLTSRTDGLQNQSQYGYGATGNPNNMLSKATSPSGSAGGTGSSQSLTYPGTSTGTLADYQPTSSTDSQGNTTTLTFDHNVNKVASAATPGNAGGTTTTSYQGDSNHTDCGALSGEVCTQTNGNGNVTGYSYDTHGNVTAITLPNPRARKTFTYDAAGRVTTAFDGRNTAYYAYDLDDRVTQVSYSSGSCPAATCVTYGYDGNGNETSRGANGVTTTFGYDALNRATSKTVGSVTTSATYDGASNMLTYTDPNGTVTYNYDIGNQLVSMSEPGGSCSGNTPVQCTKFTEDADNRRTKITFANTQTVNTAYDNAGRITTINARNSGNTIIASRTYAYTVNTAGGADQTVLNSMTDQGGTQTVYGYDTMNRLTSAAVTPSGGATTTSTWTYDKDGNRLSSKVGSATTVNAVYNGADQLCWSVAAPITGTCASPQTGSTSATFDSTGNQTLDQGQTNAFNVFNQLTSSTQSGTTTSFAYADTDNSERTSAGNTSFINGAVGISSETTAGGTINYIRDPSGTLIAERAGSTSYYFTQDALGSTIAVTGSTSSTTLLASYTYDPWGNITAQSGAQANTIKYRYISGYLDTATGDYKLGARYYNTTTGHFTQPDPSGQEANDYAYAGDNPINNSDPTGLDWAADLLGVTVGGVVGVAVTVATANPVLGAAAGGFAGGFAAGVANSSESNPQGDPNWGSAFVSGLIWGTGGGVVAGLIDGSTGEGE